MAAALCLNGGRNNSQLTRSLERILEEAALTGELPLSGRNLKEFPKAASKYDLYDTVSVDLSKNRISEFPREICDFISAEKVDCYHNVIRSVPDSINQLQCLIHLNLSRNQLAIIPPCICQLQSLQVLILCHNKLVSLPEEIRQLQKLMALDVSCNEISHLPPQIGFLNSLQSLNLRRNLLVELPIEITALHLIFLDISGNRIVQLPSRLRLMDSLVELILDNNPLSCPPAYLCTRGRIHIFKFLDIQAQKEDRKRGVLGVESDYRRSQRRTTSVDHRMNGVALENRHRHKRPPVDSGYCTSEGDKRWSQDSQEDMLKHMKSRKDFKLIDGDDQDEALLAEERRKAAAKILEHQQNEVRRNSSQRTVNASSPSSILGQRETFFNCNDGPEDTASCIPLAINERNENPFGHIQTYREYKEALKLQRSVENSSIYRRAQLDTGAGVPVPDGSLKMDITAFPRSPPAGAPAPSHISIEEEYGGRQSDSYSQQPHAHLFESQMSQLRNEDEKRKQKQLQKEAVLSYVKSRTSPLRTCAESEHYSSEDHSSLSPTPPPPPPPSLSSSTQSHAPCSPPPINGTVLHGTSRYHLSKFTPNVNSTYTIRRELERVREEKEHIQQLRLAIEMRLKVTLPEDLSSALTDGVVLCHLANHVRPRSVASIHVPSPAVPKLTVAKCRRNIENFLDACRRIGVPEDCFCTAQDILEEKNTLQVVQTVTSLLKFHVPSSHKQAHLG